MIGTALGWGGVIRALTRAMVLCVAPLQAALAQGGTTPELPQQLTVAGGPLIRDVPVPMALLLPSSAVAVALANVGVVSRDADVLFYNPGMLTQAAGLTASVQRFGPGSVASSFANVQSVGSYSIGLGVRFVRWTGLDSLGGVGRSVFTLLGQDSISLSTGLALTGGVARSLGPVRVGVSATYLHETYRAFREDAVLFDVGAAMPLGPANLGLSVQQLGGLPTDGGGLPTLPGAETDDPWLVTLGYGNRPIPISTFFDVNPVGQLSFDSEGSLLAAAGGELIYVPIDGLRFTWRLGVRSPRDNAESPVTTGFGVALDRVSLDYALDPYREGAAAHRVGIRIR